MHHAFGHIANVQPDRGCQAVTVKPDRSGCLLFKKDMPVGRPQSGTEKQLADLAPGLPYGFSPGWATVPVTFFPSISEWNSMAVRFCLWSTAVANTGCRTDTTKGISLSPTPTDAISLTIANIHRIRRLTGAWDDRSTN